MRVKKPEADAPPPPTSDGYVLAAAVLDTFQPEKLQPVEGFDADLGRLLVLSVMSEKEDGTVEWRLPNDIRRPALRVLAEQQALERTLLSGREASDPDSPYQRMFEGYIGGTPIPLDTQDLSELQASLNAVKLLDGVIPGVPDAHLVRAALVRRDFISQFEHLAGSHFVGREHEIAELVSFVDVTPAGFFNAVRRVGAGALGSIGMYRFLQEAPLLITGMGGMGKSALLSKFLLKHVRLQTTQRILFAYVDFDRPGVWPDQPLTVLAEIAQQLSLQSLEAESFEKLSAEISTELSVTTSHGEDFDSSEALLGLGTHGRTLLGDKLNDFARICRGAFSVTDTFLLVLDTFEEVSQRSDRYLEALFEFIGRLQEILPRLRVVISGRGLHDDDPEDAYRSSPIRGTRLLDQLLIEVKPLELKEIAEEEAIELLEALGSPDRRLNKGIVNRVGGHPLSLKLAAQLVATIAGKLGKAPGELTSAEVFGSQWLERMSEGFLYRRIVAHISDVPLQKLADPGLILRELTADLIYYVLNEPCRLELSSDFDAARLFSRLKRYTQLVSVQSEEVVRHRPELRRRILKEMMHGQAKLCRDIWTHAARYYQDRDENRTEELYCRLMLDEDPAVLASRWQYGLEKRLLKSRGEMPVRARQFLDLMALVSDGRTQESSLVTEDLDLSVLAEEMKILLSRGNAKEALDMFRATGTGRTPRFDSALYAVYVRAMAQAGDLDGAMSRSIVGLDRLEEAGKAGDARYEDLLLLCCQVTRAQHGLDTGKLRFAARRVLRRMKPMEAGQLAVRFGRLDFYDGRPLHALRIAVVLLELFNIESGETDESDAQVVYGDPFGWSQKCANYGFDALQRLGPDYAGVDGGLLVRALAWLSPFYGATPVLVELLSVPQVRAVLHRDYEKLLMDWAKRRGSEISRRWQPHLFGAREGLVPGVERGVVSGAEMQDIGSALRTVINARDTAQGSLFG